MKSINNIQGGIFIEMIFVLVITCMLLIPIYFLLVSNIKAYNSLSDSLELQYQAQVAMDEMINKIINSQGIEKIYNISREDKTNTSVKIKVSKIIFNNIEKNIVIEQRNSGLWFGYELTAEVIFANYIEYLEIEPINTNFYESEGIVITLKLKKNNNETVINNKIFFRNYKNDVDYNLR